MNHVDFLNKYQKLKASFPKNPDYCYNNENTSHCGYVGNCVNCYYCFDSYYNKNCLYCFDSVRSGDCIDCDYAVDSELLYESVDVFKCYNSLYLNYCARLYDSYFCYNCDDSHDLFGCAHLSQKQYCVFNKQYGKEEYLQKIKELLKEPALKYLQQLTELVKKYPSSPSTVPHSENSDYGNFLAYCSNVYLSFDSAHDENCGYLYDSHYCKDSYDITQGYKLELCYESEGATSYNCDYIEWSNNCFDSSYLFSCTDCHNCFGCAHLSHKKFCFLNKQYAEDEYKKIVAEVKQSVR